MPWSDKKIEDAIVEAKRKKAIFVVYVIDDNNKESLENVVQSPEIAELLSSDRIVAITIGSKSQSYKFFQNIYQLVPVPSIFFIGENGWPLEIVTTELPVEAVLPRIRRLLEQSEDSEVKPEIVAAETSVAATAGTSSQFVETPTPALYDESEQAGSAIHSSKNIVSITTEEQKEEEQEHAPSNTRCPLKSLYEDPTIKTSEFVSSISAVTSEQSEMAQENETLTLTSDDSTQSASQSYEEASDKDTKNIYHVQTVRFGPHPGISKPQIVPELQQETHGQGVVPLVSRYSNPPTPGILENIGEWMRNILYGGRPTTLRACQDAAGNKNEASRIASRCSNMVEDESRWPREARIQFRLPDGSTQSESFLSTTTIGELREYVQNNVTLPFRSFSLSTSYPRLEFTSEHYDVPIGALGLAPRSVILIIPGSQVSPQSGLALQTLWTIIVWPFSAIYSLFVMLNVWLFGGDPANDSTNSSSQSRAGQQSDSVTSLQSSQPNTSGARRRSPTSSSVHRDGNVHRLVNRPDDSDEDNNTWNGNSTQQM